MTIKHYLCLSGWGCLREIVRKDDKFIVKLGMLSSFDAAGLNQDDVQIDCEVDNETHKTYFDALLKSIEVGQCVTVHFTAEYNAFLNAYSGQTPEDPKQMVFLRGTLKELNHCSINSHLKRTERVLLDATA